MQKFSFLFSFLFFVLQISAQDFQSKADEYLNILNSQQKFNGAVLVAKEGKVLYQKGFGYRDIDKKVKHDAQSIFQIGSVTKQFTSAIIMQLQQEKKLSVKDKISKYFPTFPRGNEITIENLLAHTSGIYNYTTDQAFMMTKVAIPHTEEQMIALFRDKPLDFEPGSKFNYSNSGYMLLGYIIQRVTGKPYEQVVRERILQPLQMNHSGFDFTNLANEYKTTGYYTITDTVVNAAIVDSTVSYAAGALYSTVGDLYKWEQALYGDKIMNKESKKIVYTPVHNKYGYGWSIDTLYGKVTYSHGGGIHGFTSYLLRFPGEKLVIILLDNSGGGKLGPMGKDLAAMVLGKPYTKPVTTSEVKLDEKVLQQYVGEYELTPTFKIVVTLENGQLKAQATNQPQFDIYAEKEDLFFLKVVEAKIEFEKDETGKISGLILHQGGQKLPGKKIK